MKFPFFGLLMQPDHSFVTNMYFLHICMRKTTKPINGVFTFFCHCHLSPRGSVTPKPQVCEEIGKKPTIIAMRPSATKVKLTNIRCIFVF